MQALCCSHFLLRFVFGFPGFSGSSAFRNWSHWKGQAEQESDHAMRLETKADGDSIFLLFKIELLDVHWVIEMCLWLASMISLHFNVLCFGRSGIFNSGFRAMPDSSIADQQPRCWASISGWRTAWETSQFCHGKMPCFMSWQERWSWFRRKSAVCLVPWLWIFFAHLGPLFGFLNCGINKCVIVCRTCLGEIRRCRSVKQDGVIGHVGLWGKGCDSMFPGAAWQTVAPWRSSRRLGRCCSCSSGTRVFTGTSALWCSGEQRLIIRHHFENCNRRSRSVFWNECFVWRVLSWTCWTCTLSTKIESRS